MMNSAEAYNLCCRYSGRRVRISDNRGRTHVGRITKVDNRHVWLMPDGPVATVLAFGELEEKDLDLVLASL